MLIIWLIITALVVIIAVRLRTYWYVRRARIAAQEARAAARIAPDPLARFWEEEASERH